MPATLAPEVDAPDADVAGDAPDADDAGADDGGASVSPLPKRSPATGDCRCIPKTWGHGVHEGWTPLSPRWPAPLECECRARNQRLCLARDPARGTCAERWVQDGRPGAPCRGSLDQDVVEDGVQAGCRFSGIKDTYPRPEGAACNGFTVDGRRSVGKTWCPPFAYSSRNKRP